MQQVLTNAMVKACDPRSSSLNVPCDPKSKISEMQQQEHFRQWALAQEYHRQQELMWYEAQERANAVRDHSFGTYVRPQIKDSLQKVRNISRPNKVWIGVFVLLTVYLGNSKGNQTIPPAPEAVPTPKVNSAGSSLPFEHIQTAWSGPVDQPKPACNCDDPDSWWGIFRDRIWAYRVSRWDSRVLFSWFDMMGGSLI